MLANMQINPIHSEANRGAKLAFFQLTMLLIGFSLLIDAINGFFLVGLGIDPRLSATYKLLLLVLILFQIGSYSVKALGMVFLIVILFLIGPVITLSYTLDIAGFIADFIASLKILTAYIVFIYCVQVCKNWPELLLKYGKYCCQFSFLVLFVNLVLGILGYGFSSYGDGDLDSEKTIGIKGFFYAGNELGGIFIILFGFALHSAWQRKNKFLYLLLTPTTIFFGLLIATKAAMLAGTLLVFIIPVLNERNRLFNLTWLKVKLLAPIIIVFILLMLFLVPILESTGLWGRLVWFYEKKGVLGLILSGRDEFIIAAVSAFDGFTSLSQVIFGLGRTGLGLFAKESIEVDPIDMYFWFGISGGVFFVFLLTLFTRLSYLATKEKDSYWGPLVLIVNLMLFTVSIVAGHIITSGMLGPLFGLVNGMAYADYYLKKKDNLGKVLM